MKGVTQIRQLQAGETRPSGEPRRYRNGTGYVRLRWKVAPRSYVEAYEHRVVAGLDAEEVHHVNRDPSDNRSENLVAVTTVEHGEAHATWPIGEACDLYRSGMSLVQLSKRYGKCSSQIMRALKLRGVQMRPVGFGKRVDVDDAEVSRLFSAGYGRRSIAARMGIGEALVARSLREQGHRRGPGRVITGGRNHG